MSTSLQAETPTLPVPKYSPDNPRFVSLDWFPDTSPDFNPPRTHGVWVYLPADYATSNKSYPVIYFHDGEYVFAAGHNPRLTFDPLFADVAYDRLIQQDLINPAILVAVAPSYGNRGYEYTPRSAFGTTRPAGDRNPNPNAMPNPNRNLNADPYRLGRIGGGGGGGGGGIDEYYDFLAHQVKPYIDSHFRTLTDPAHTGVAGASLGGLASAYLGYHHPETFGMAGCMSPSMQSVLSQFENETSPKSATRFWFVCGVAEGPRMWGPTIRAAAALKRRGWVEGKDVALGRLP